MAKGRESLMERLRHRISLRHWRRVAEAVPGFDLKALRQIRAEARALRYQLDRVIHHAEYRLALPMIGSNALRRPMGTDWIWRPVPWQGRIAVPGLVSAASQSRICDDTTLFHDCHDSELTLRQIRNTREADLAPFGLRMDVFRFDGSFLSLVLDAPEEAVAGLRLDHILRLDAIVEVEKPLEIFARLNIKHGPNVEQMVRELPLNAEEVMVEFDLAYTKVNEARVERVWIDLIFEGPEMNQITLRDVNVSRRPRAAF